MINRFPSTPTNFPRRLSADLIGQPQIFFFLAPETSSARENARVDRLHPRIPVSGKGTPFHVHVGDESSSCRLRIRIGARMKGIKSLESLMESRSDVMGNRYEESRHVFALDGTSNRHVGLVCSISSIDNDSDYVRVSNSADKGLTNEGHIIRSRRVRVSVSPFSDSRDECSRIDRSHRR